LYQYINESTGNPNKPISIGNQANSVITVNTGYWDTLITWPRNQYKETITVDIRIMKPLPDNLKVGVAIISHKAIGNFRI